jgi:biotin carboxyl carrier protein
VFMSYTLAGAYDSNIALLLTVGRDRLDSYQRLAEILRVTQLSGRDLATNLEFHYGLVNWFIGTNINARPTTRFIVPYLTAVGRLKERANNVDLDQALAQIRARQLAGVADFETRKALAVCIDRKQTLLLRPIQKLFAEPHLFAGWLGLYRDRFAIVGGRLRFVANPIQLLIDTYHYLNMDYRDNCPAAYMIWDHDYELLETARQFYASITNLLRSADWEHIDYCLQRGDAPVGVDEHRWEDAKAAHAGYLSATELLLVLPYIAHQSNFYQLAVNPDLSIHIPEALLDASHQIDMAKVLVPPPAARSDEILAVSGGMYYPRESPGAREFLSEGQHFDKGDPLYIVEVMKMFNKVYATFSGTVAKVLVAGDGVIIKKGQPLFKIIPDEVVAVETPQQTQARRATATAEFLAMLGIAA